MTTKTIAEQLRLLKPIIKPVKKIEVRRRVGRTWEVRYVDLNRRYLLVTCNVGFVVTIYLRGAGSWGTASACSVVRSRRFRSVPRGAWHQCTRATICCSRIRET